MNALESPIWPPDTGIMEKPVSQPESKCYCRPCLRARLGDEAFEHATALGRNAPPPSPQLVEKVRRIFAAAELSARAQEAATGRRLISTCPRPDCECGRSADAPGANS